MNTTRTISRDQLLPLTCTREGFQIIILSEIEQSNNHFSFEELISGIKSKCDFKIEHNVNYLGTIDFLKTDFDFINKIIWEQIWDKKLMIDFTVKRQDRNPNIFHFAKTNGQTQNNNF
jgi:hypothetical protein